MGTAGQPKVIIIGKMKMSKILLAGLLGFVALILSTSCEKLEYQKDTSIQVLNYNLQDSCIFVQLYDFENYGKLHNEILIDILTNANIDSVQDLTLQLNNYIGNKYDAIQLQIMLNENPWSTWTEILNRSSTSVELKSFVGSVFNFIYNTNGLLMNQEYQKYISAKLNDVNLLSNIDDRNNARIFLAVLSNSIDFWLPKKYCGKGGYKLVFRTDLDGELETRRRSWLTNFADIWSLDCIGAVAFCWTANPAVVGASFAGASAGRALSLAWDGGY